MTWNLTLILPTTKTHKMPITYDLKTDIRYLQGVEANRIEAVKRSLTLNNLTIEQIAYIQSMPVEEVKRIKKDMELDADSSDNQDTDTTD